MYYEFKIRPVPDGLNTLEVEEWLAGMALDRWEAVCFGAGVWIFRRPKEDQYLLELNQDIEDYKYMCETNPSEYNIGKLAGLRQAKSQYTDNGYE